MDLGEKKGTIKGIKGDVFFVGIVFNLRIWLLALYGVGSR